MSQEMRRFHVNDKMTWQTDFKLSLLLLHFHFQFQIEPAKAARPDERQRFVAVDPSSSSSEDDGILEQVEQPDVVDEPPARNARQGKTNSAVAREANQLYISFAKESLPNLMDKMNQCMNKFLDNCLSFVFVSNQAFGYLFYKKYPLLTF